MLYYISIKRGTPGERPALETSYLKAVSKVELGTVVFLINHDNNHNDGKDYHNILIDTHHKHLLLPSIELRIQRQRLPMYKLNIEGQPSTVTGVPVDYEYSREEMLNLARKVTLLNLW